MTLLDAAISGISFMFFTAMAFRGLEPVVRFIGTTWASGAALALSLAAATIGVWCIFNVPLLQSISP